MTWNAALADSAGAWLATFGTSAHYRAAGLGEPVAITAIDTPEAQSVGQSGFVEIRHEIHIARAAIPAPARGDTITFTPSNEGFIIQTHEPDGDLWRLIVRRGGA